MIIVCGTQRSGTTVLAQFLQQNDYYMGENFFYDNRVSGGLESPHIAWFIRELLNDNDFPFAGFDEYFQNEKRLNVTELEKCFDFQKSSYILMHPLFITKYLDANPSHSFIILLRDTQEVVASKKKHNKQFSKDATILQQKPTTLASNIKNSLKVISERKARLVFLSYPDFLLAKKETAEKLLDFGIHLKEDWSIKWDELVDYEKISYF